MFQSLLSKGKKGKFSFQRAEKEEKSKEKIFFPAQTGQPRVSHRWSEKLLFSEWNKITVAVFFSLLFSLAIIVLGSAFREIAFLSLLRAAAGAFALFFPTGWLFLAFLFPEKQKISIVSRIALSIALSVAFNNLVLQGIFYFLPFVPLNLSLNIIVLALLGAFFFSAWAFVAGRGTD